MFTLTRGAQVYKIPALLRRLAPGHLCPDAYSPRKIH